MTFQGPGTKVTITIFSKKVIEQVDELARREFRNRSEVIREATKQYIERNNVQERIQQQAAMAELVERNKR